MLLACVAALGEPGVGGDAEAASPSEIRTEVLTFAVSVAVVVVEHPFPFPWPFPWPFPFRSPSLTEPALAYSGDAPSVRITGAT